MVQLFNQLTMLYLNFMPEVLMHSFDIVLLAHHRIICLSNCVLSEQKLLPLRLDLQLHLISPLFKPVHLLVEPVDLDLQGALRVPDLLIDVLKELIPILLRRFEEDLLECADPRLDLQLI